MSSRYIFKHEKFEGPLELLLEFIEKEKLSISEISLAKVADEYIQHVKNLDKIDPEELAEFLVVAAQLMLIKSRSLLPQLKLTEEEEGSIEELEKRLKEYQRIRQLAAELKKLEAARRHIVSREAYWGLKPVFYPSKKITAEVLSEAFAAVLSSIPKITKLAEEKLRHIISLEEKISHIKSVLQGALERTFFEVIKGTKEKAEIIVSFLAILELSRQKFLELKQEKVFGDITIRRI
jgi:segregation and condensation protein A